MPAKKKKQPIQPAARYKRLLAWLELARKKQAAAERSIALLSKQIARLERRYKDDIGQWQTERTATKAGRNSALRRRKEAHEAVKSYAKLLGFDPDRTVSSLYNTARRHVGYFIRSSEGFDNYIYLFGKGWFKDCFVPHGGRSWRGGVPFARPDKQQKDRSDE